MIEPRLGEAHCDPETAVRPGLLGMLVHKGRETAVGRQKVKLLRKFLVEPCNRSEERRVGKECVRTCRFRGVEYHEKKQESHQHTKSQSLLHNLIPPSRMHRN